MFILHDFETKINICVVVFLQTTNILFVVEEWMVKLTTADVSTRVKSSSSNIVIVCESANNHNHVVDFNDIHSHLIYTVICRSVPTQFKQDVWITKHNNSNLCNLHI